MKFIHLTPTEAEIINHRLEVADCIAEVYGPDNDNVWHLDDIEDVQTKVEDLIDEVFSFDVNGSCAIRFDPKNVDHILILNEVIEGNTMSSIVQDMREFETGEPTKIEGDRLVRHMRNIDKKFEAAGLDFGFHI